MRGRFFRALHQSIEFPANNIRLTIDGFANDGSFKGSIYQDGEWFDSFVASKADMDNVIKLGPRVRVEMVHQALHSENCTYWGPERRGDLRPWLGRDRRQKREA